MGSKRGHACVSIVVTESCSALKVPALEVTYPVLDKILEVVILQFTTLFKYLGQIVGFVLLKQYLGIMRRLNGGGQVKFTFIPLKNI